MQYVQTGKIKPLAVASPERIAILPERADGERERLCRLRRQRLVSAWRRRRRRRATSSPASAQRIADDRPNAGGAGRRLTPLGYDLGYVDSRHFAEKIADDHARYGKVIRDAGITPD